MAHWQKRKRIKPISDKRQQQIDEYNVLRVEYVKTHRVCEAIDCKKPAGEIHHMRGRSGKQLLVVDDFMAVCRECHRYIEEHPDWAKAKGYSRSRLEL